MSNEAETTRQKPGEGSVPPEVPVYAFIKRELKNQIENGELTEGDRIPSEAELARQYGVSRNPTRQALRDLEFEGYIVRTPGRGSFVAPMAQRQRLFRVGEWRTLAIACPEMECRYSRAVISGFIRSAAEKGFHTMVYFARLSNDAEFEFLADMRNSGIEGVAFWLQHASQRTLDLLNKFHRVGFPFVLIDRYVRGLDADFVVTDNVDAAYQLTNRLIARGHREIGFVTGEMDNTSNADRLKGYRRAIEEAGLGFHERSLGIFDGEGESTHAAVARIMAQRRRPTAFFSVNDGAAAKLVDSLGALGYAIPGEVELALIDDNAFAEAAGIPMIKASQAGYEMGRESAEILMARATGQAIPLQQRFLKAKIEDECLELASAQDRMDDVRVGNS
jgi:DNA-binding LacI/PurR family transcriptional regulator